HSLAPGTGDPAGFVIDDCTTQRNLNEQGRAQAAGWHSLLAAHTSSAVAVYSSPWCRCVETANLINLGPVTTLDFLGSFFAGRGDAEQYTADTRQWLNQLPPGKPIVVVTHQVNITALTGIYPRSNEGILVALPITNRAEVLARLH
ncbi:MAG TPA: histidine phosphatase family protein, partial [Cellvibrionaceae bacterium]